MGSSQRQCQTLCPPWAGATLSASPGDLHVISAVGHLSSLQHSGKGARLNSNSPAVCSPLFLLCGSPQLVAEWLWWGSDGINLVWHSGLNSDGRRGSSLLWCLEGRFPRRHPLLGCVSWDLLSISARHLLPTDR